VHASLRNWLHCCLLGSLHVAAFLVPAMLLAGAALRAQDAWSSRFLWMGSAVLVVVAGSTVFASHTWRRPTGPAVVMLYLLGLGWIIFGWHGQLDSYVALSQAVLLILPLLALGYQILRDGGVIEIRRAQVLARRIATRSEGRLDLSACRELPEVKAFREALHSDPTPALALLARKRNEVRLAALCALEFRKDWRRGQAQLVLRLARDSNEPAIRAAAVMALANLDNRELVEKLSRFLRDPAPIVRRAAATALLWDSEHRWGWIRLAVQEALADAALVRDGSIWQNGEPLCPDAVADLRGWAAVSGPLSVRSAATLAAHYRRALLDENDPVLIDELRQCVANTSSPATLRQELAQMLHQQNELPVPLLQQMMQPANPAPLRLFAAETLLSGRESPEAVLTLRELARVPNREIALATAYCVQRRLGVDLGLDLEATLPALHTRQAAEITRRVMRWAASSDKSLDALDKCAGPTGSP
jgi:HEAT repeat protein